MKEWCLAHPYLTFFIVMGGLSTFSNAVSKLTELFVKPTPTTVNMNFDPAKLQKQEDIHEDTSVH